MVDRKVTIAVAIVVIGVVALLLLIPAPSKKPVADTRVEAPPPVVQTPPVSDEALKLRARLAEEIRARQRAEAEAAGLRAKLAPLQSNVVISLGRVEDIGKRAALFLPAVGELEALNARDPSTLSTEEKRRLLQLQRDHAQLLGALAEITHFQDNPDEYGRFFRSMFQEAGGLNDLQAGQVETYMRERAMMMNQLELNAAKEPTDPVLEGAWETRRDKFNEETATGLKGLLPPGVAEKLGFGPDLMEFLEMDFDKLTPKRVE